MQVHQQRFSIRGLKPFHSSSRVRGKLKDKTLLNNGTGSNSSFEHSLWTASRSFALLNIQRCIFSDLYWHFKKWTKKLCQNSRWKSHRIRRTTELLTLTWYFNWWNWCCFSKNIAKKIWGSFPTLSLNVLSEHGIQDMPTGNIIKLKKKNKRARVVNSCQHLVKNIMNDNPIHSIRWKFKLLLSAMRNLRLVTMPTWEQLFTKYSIWYAAAET